MKKGKDEEEFPYSGKYIGKHNSSDSIPQTSSERISCDTDSNKVLKWGLLLGTLVLGFAIKKILRLNKKKHSITDDLVKGNYINQFYDVNLSKAKEELIALGKNSAPEFVMKFKEAYPELCEKLFRIQPNLVNSELAFCAYLKLNFTTKEIARYISVTPRAVQMRKNRIRKRLNISAGEDLYLWMDRV